MTMTMTMSGLTRTSPRLTAVAIDATSAQVGQRRFVVNAGTFKRLMAWTENWPERRFAVKAHTASDEASPSGWLRPASTRWMCRLRGDSGNRRAISEVERSRRTRQNLTPGSVFPA